jgi:hypothetical protein
MSEVIESQVIELPEQRYEYQPTDEEGRAIGARQVIKYRTQSELTEKLIEQNTLLIRKLRKETRNNRLGITENENIGENVPKLSDPVMFTPRELNDDQRVDIARRLMDPTTALDATSELLEAKLGAPIETIGKTLSEVQLENLRLRARVESNAFMLDNPEYFKCQENYEAITSWMIKNNLAPVKANFQLAYDTLKGLGVLIEGPKPVQPVQPVQETPVQPVAPVAPVQPVTLVQEPVRHIPFSLNNDNSSNVGSSASGNDIVYELIYGGEYKNVSGQQMLVGAQKKVLTGQAAIDAMPSEEYKKRLLHEKGFAEKVQALDATLRKR